MKRFFTEKKAVSGGSEKKRFLSKCTDGRAAVHLKVEIFKIASIVRKRFPVLITLRGRCLRDTFLLTSFRINELALDKVIYVPRPTERQIQQQWIIIR